MRLIPFSVTIARMSISIDRLVRTRRKTVAIVVERDGSLTVRAPLRMAEARIHTFVESHESWIAKTPGQDPGRSARTIQKLLGRRDLSLPGTVLPAQPSFHASVPPCLLTGALSGWRNPPCRKRSKLSHAGIRNRRLCSFLNECSALLENTASHIKRSASRLPAHVGVRAVHAARSASPTGWSWLRRRWWITLSCMNWYTRRSSNHSKTFWNRLGELMPDYKRRLTWLKKNGKFLI